MQSSIEMASSLRCRPTTQHLGRSPAGPRPGRYRPADRSGHGSDVEQLIARLSNDDAKFAWLARQLDTETAEKSSHSNFPASTKSGTGPLSPGGSDVARGVIGRTDIDGIGQSGLELQFDNYLTGEEGRVVVERGLASGGARAVTIPDGRYELVTPVSGESLVLTLDRTVQFEVESLLKQHVASAGAASGTVIVVVPTPARSSRWQRRLATTARSRFRATTDRSRPIVEPGSISKPLAMAALIDEGLADERTTVKITDEIEIYDIRFADPIRHETDVLTAPRCSRHRRTSVSLSRRPALERAAPRISRRLRHRVAHGTRVPERESQESCRTPTTGREYRSRSPRSATGMRQLRCRCFGPTTC